MLADRKGKPDIKPKAYWINTSGNRIIRHFIGLADRKTRREIEQLIAGEPVRKSIQQELTYSDILIEIEDEDTGIVIEIKYAKDGNLDAGCQAALEQIREKGYEEKLREEGMKKILDFGIAFFKKRCRVVCRV